MSLTVIKPGIVDTIQDMGRYGYQYLGINPGGAMDRYAAQVVNLLVGNEANEAVIEMHFPAAAFLFRQETIIAIGGADFIPSINGDEVPLWHPIVVSRNSILQFQNIRQGVQCYVAIMGGLDIPKWLGSFSTHIKAAVGGFQGRTLQKDDSFHFRKQECCTRYLADREYRVLPWQADINWWGLPVEKIAILPGTEWCWLTKEIQRQFITGSSQVTFASDRMGYRLTSLSGSWSDPSIFTINKTELVSSAVNFGTIQLLPDGQLIVLMADHQTTGGYPKIAHVISAHLSHLSQVRPGEKIQFTLTDVATAERLLIRQRRHLMQLENACRLRLEDFLKS